MIRSAWLFGPYYAAQTAGPAALISWLIGGGPRGAMVLIITFTFAEFSTMFPVAGGSSTNSSVQPWNDYEFC